MQSGRCCNCNHRVLRPINIKAISIVDGVTEWEYGVAAMYSHHYGLDAITAIEGDTSALKNKYVVSCPMFESSASYPLSTIGMDAHNRNASTCVANCSESLYLTKLNSITGAVITSTLIAGWFTKEIPTQLFFETWNTNQRAGIGLSGGDYAISGQLRPSIEFVDFSSNTINKTYKLHAHGNNAGQIHLKTRTSNETISINYNATAAAVKLLFEATADCVSATVTGGPWPLLPITVAATWSVAAGDIKRIDADLFSVVGASTNRPTASVFFVYSTSTGLLTSTVGYLFGFGISKGSSVFPANSALTPTAPAFPAFGTPAIGAMGVSNDWYGSGNGSAGPGNNIIGTGGFPDARGQTLECWNVSTTWTLAWCKVSQTSCGGSINIGYNSGLENGNVLMSFNRRISSANPTRSLFGATIAVTTGVVTEFDNTSISISSPSILTRMLYNDHTQRLFNRITRLFSTSDYNTPPLQFYYHLDGQMHQVGSTTMHLEGEIRHADATQVYGYLNNPNPSSSEYFNYDPPSPTPPPFGLTSAKTYAHTFYTAVVTHAHTGTQFRFVLGRNPITATDNPQIITAWIDWHATAAQINTALINAIGENTAGVGSSVQVWPFGEPTAASVNTISQLEKGLLIHFAGAPSKFSQAYLTQNFRLNSYFVKDQIKIETQTPTWRAAAGVAAWSASTGAVIWSRPFGDQYHDPPYSPPRTILFPLISWLKADYLYGVNLAENELP